MLRNTLHKHRFFLILLVVAFVVAILFYYVCYGWAYPTILAILFKIFGANFQVAFFFSIFLGAASIFLVFLLTKIIFKKDSLALLAALIYGLTPQNFYYLFVRNGFPVLLSFWLLSFLISAAVFFIKLPKFSLLILAATFILLASQTKPEYFILVLVLPIGFLIFWKPLKKYYRNFPLKKIILYLSLSGNILLLFSMPILAENLLFKERIVDGWCGIPSQRYDFDVGIKTFSMPPAIEQIDKILRFIFNDWFSFSWLIYDLPTFFNFWTQASFLIILPLLIFGILFGLKNNFRITVFIILVPVFISLVYLLACTYYEARYAIPLYGPIILFVAGGVDFLTKKLETILKRNYFTPVLFVVMAIFVGWNFSGIIKVFRLAKNPDIYRQIAVNPREIEGILKNVSTAPSKTKIITLTHNEMIALKFYGWQSDCLLDKINETFSENSEEFLAFLRFLKSLPDFSEEDYFLLKRDYLNASPFIIKLTGLVQKNCNLEEIYSNDSYLLYKLKNN